MNLKDSARRGRAFDPEAHRDAIETIVAVLRQSKLPSRSLDVEKLRSQTQPELEHALEVARDLEALLRSRSLPSRSGSEFTPTTTALSATPTIRKPRRPRGSTNPCAVRRVQDYLDSLEGGQEKLAEKALLEVRTIQRLVSGAPLARRSWTKVARAMGVTFDELFKS